MPQRDVITPEIFVDKGLEALDFYRRAFGAIERARRMNRDGTRLLNGELELLGHRLFVCDEFPANEGGTGKAPRTLSGTTVRMNLEVDNADAVVAQAVSAGATVMFPPTDMFWGARYAKIKDPYGHEWGINQQTKELTVDQEAEGRLQYFAETAKK